MANSILKLKVESSEYDAKLKKAAEGIQHLAEVAHRGGGELTGLEKAELDYISALGDMSTKSRTAAGSVRELENTFKELTVVYNNLNEVEKNDEGGKALAASLEQIKQRAQEARAQLDTATQSLNSNGQQVQESSSLMDALASKFTVNIDALKLFDMGLKAAGVALDVVKDAFFNNEEQLDEWGRTVESADSLYKGFLNALNTGDISGYLSNISNIVQAAREAYDALDALGTYNAFNQINVEKTRTGMTESIADYRSGNSSKDAVKAAGEAYKNELKERKRMEKDAYLGAVKDMALQRGVSEKDLLDALSGTYGHYQDLKKVMPTGTATKYVPGVIPGTAGRYETYNVAQNDQERLGEALRHLNDTELRSLQALGAQAERTGNEIAQVDKQLTRVLNGRQIGGSSGNGGGGGGGNAEVVAVSGSIDEQTKKVQELQKAWRAAADDDSRRKIKEEMESAQAVLDNMSGKVFDTSNLKQIAPTAIASPKMEVTDPMGGLTAMKQSIQLELKTEAVKVDETTLHTLLKDAVQNGINGMDFQFNALGEKIGEGIDVPQSAWEGILEQYNALREQIGLEPIKINFETGNIDQVNKDAKSMSKGFQSATAAIQAVGSAMSQIEDPAAKVMGTIAQAIATIAFTFAKSLDKTFTPWDWIAAAAAGTATMISTISAIHSATGYAQGGIVKGSSYSGDNIPALVDGNQMVGLDAGEVVLTRAMAGNLASQLEGDGIRGGGYIPSHVSGEQIWIAVNNYTRRTGKGELVTWR